MGKKQGREGKTGRKVLTMCIFQSGLMTAPLCNCKYDGRNFESLCSGSFLTDLCSRWNLSILTSFKKRLQFRDSFYHCNRKRITPILAVMINLVTSRGRTPIKLQNCILYDSAKKKKKKKGNYIRWACI